MKDTIPLNEALELTISMFQEQNKKLSLAMQIIEKLEESNAFYADYGNWSANSDYNHFRERIDNDTNIVSSETNHSVIAVIAGRTARKTIKEVEELKRGLR